MNKYSDRQQAGIKLAQLLTNYSHRKDVIVLALPRGGVPVAYEVAKALSLPLDIFIVRKLGVPGYEELAFGAIAMDGTIFFNQNIIDDFNLSKVKIEQVIQKELEELHRRELVYRGNRLFPTLKDKTIILIDDGIATGATIRAAIKAIQAQKPTSLIIAIPVAPLSTYQELTNLVDKIVCPLKPINFNAVGLWYENFSQTTDKEVIELYRASILSQA